MKLNKLLSLSFFLFLMLLTGMFVMPHKADALMKAYGHVYEYKSGVKDYKTGWEVVIMSSGEHYCDEDGICGDEPSRYISQTTGTNQGDFDTGNVMECTQQWYLMPVAPGGQAGKFIITYQRTVNGSPEVDENGNPMPQTVTINVPNGGNPTPALISPPKYSPDNPPTNVVTFGGDNNALSFEFDIEWVPECGINENPVAGELDILPDSDALQLVPGPNKYSGRRVSDSGSDWQNPLAITLYVQRAEAPIKQMYVGFYEGSEANDYTAMYNTIADTNNPDVNKGFLLAWGTDINGNSTPKHYVLIKNYAGQTAAWQELPFDSDTQNGDARSIRNKNGDVLFNGTALSDDPYGYQILEKRWKVDFQKYFPSQKMNTGAYVVDEAGKTAFNGNLEPGVSIAGNSCSSNLE